MFVSITAICDLHNFLPCSPPDFYKSCWGAAELQPYWSVDYPEWQYARHCLSLINLTLLFHTKHRMSQEEKLCLDFATYTEMTLLRKTPIHTHTNPKNTELYLYVYVFRKDSETTAVFQIEFMSNDNRIIECFGFERTLKIISFLKDHLLPAPCYVQGHLPLQQVVQNPIQTGLEHFHNFSR